MKQFKHKEHHTAGYTVTSKPIFSIYFNSFLEISPYVPCYIHSTSTPSPKEMTILMLLFTIPMFDSKLYYITTLKVFKQASYYTHHSIFSLNIMFLAISLLIYVIQVHFNCCRVFHSTTMDVQIIYLIFLSYLLQITYCKKS